MGVETNVLETMSTTKIVFMFGLWSDYTRLLHTTPTATKNCLMDSSGMQEHMEGSDYLVAAQGWDASSPS